MTVEQDFVNLLLGDAGVAAQVGPNINLGIADQGVAPPMLVINSISPGLDYTLDGVNEFAEKRFQVDCYALDYVTVLAARNAVLACVHAVRFFTQGATQFQGIFVDADEDSFDFDETTEKKFRRRIDLIIIARGT